MSSRRFTLNNLLRFMHICYKLRFAKNPELLTCITLVLDHFKEENNTNLKYCNSI